MEANALYEFVANKTGKCKILVVGDVMLDKYYYGEVTRISPEAPVPITRVMDQKETLGGAANVAHNLALLGCQTSIAGFVGEDYHCQSLVDKFTSRGIDYKGLITTQNPTTTKLRVIGGHQQMLRLDFEETAPVRDPYAARLLNYIEQKLNESIDCLIISDYGKGACTEAICQQVVKAADEAEAMETKIQDLKEETEAKEKQYEKLFAEMKAKETAFLEKQRQLEKDLEASAKEQELLQQKRKQELEQKEKALREKMVHCI